jgi:hypothetical protein
VHHIGLRGCAPLCVLAAHLHRLVQHLGRAAAPHRVLPKLLLHLRQKRLHSGAVGLRIDCLARWALLKLADEAAGPNSVTTRDGGQWMGGPAGWRHCNHLVLLGSKHKPHLFIFRTRSAAAGSLIFSRKDVNVKPAAESAIAPATTDHQPQLWVSM